MAKFEIKSKMDEEIIVKTIQNILDGNGEGYVDSAEKSMNIQNLMDFVQQEIEFNDDLEHFEEIVGKFFHLYEPEGKRVYLHEY